MYYFHPCGREIGFFKFAFPFRVWRVWACVLCDSRCSQLVSMDRGGCLGEGGSSFPMPMNAKRSGQNSLEGRSCSETFKYEHASRSFGGRHEF